MSEQRLDGDSSNGHDVPEEESPSTAMVRYGEDDLAIPADDEEAEAILKAYRLRLPEVSNLAGAKGAEIVRIQKLLEIAQQQYVEDPCANNAFAIQGFQRTMRELIESYEEKVDPERQAQRLEYAMAEFSDHLIKAIALEMRRYGNDTILLDPGNADKHRRNMTEAFRRVGKQADVELRNLRAALGVIFSAKPGDKRRK